MSPARLLYQRRSNKRQPVLASMARPNCERQYPAGKANNGNQHKLVQLTPKCKSLLLRDPQC
jgi:hypothetical protein